MSRNTRVKQAVDKLLAEDKPPVKIKMSRNYMIGWKKEVMPEIDKHFINGRMTFYGIELEIDESVRGYEIVHQLGVSIDG